MNARSITAQASPNIALIKYWGNRDDSLRLPANGSIAMSLDGLQTRTSVAWEAGQAADSLTLNGIPTAGAALARVTNFLDLVRALAGFELHAKVASENNFPIGAGIASSASAFAALALASSRAAGLDLDEAGLSRLARRGSGSACRSIPGGFTEWLLGTGDADSYAVAIAPPAHWDLADCVAIVSTVHKPTGSTVGNTLAGTSPLQPARVADTSRRLDLCRRAILERDFAALAAIVEFDSDLMHAVMMTSTPQLFYWQPPTLAVMAAVREARAQGLPVCYTVDAGPNVHVLTEASRAGQVIEFLRAVPGVRDVLRAGVGGPARLLP
ncbi:MAG: diphosphomevalonate decarboxylase [Anaerolineales bacterium]|nr:diphosphomevalonate decarboxylase [Anaerolineales bacterium]